MIASFPYYTQYDTMDCGPACLRMIAKHYGRHYRLDTLRQKCHISREGVRCAVALHSALETMSFCCAL